MDKPTAILASYISERKTPISAISDATGIPYQRLWANLSDSKSAGREGRRGLQAGDFLAICNFLGKNPMDFYPDTRDSA